MELATGLSVLAQFSTDTVTVTLRIALMVWAIIGAVGVPYMYRRSADHNVIPWAYLATVLAAYALNMMLIIAGARLTVAGWWRPVFSILNINLIAASLWVLWRSVTRPHGGLR